MICFMGFRSCLFALSLPRRYKVLADGSVSSRYKIYVCIYIYICVYVCMYVCNICMYVCICVYMCMCVYVCMYGMLPSMSVLMFV